MALDKSLLEEMDKDNPTTLSSKSDMFSQMDMDSGFPSNSVESPASKLGNAAIATGAALGAGTAALYGTTKLAPKIASPVGKAFARVAADLTPKTLETVDRIGFDKVRSIGEKSGEYLANVVIPKAKQNVLRAISFMGKDATDTLDDLGFKPYEVEELRGISKTRLQDLSKQASTNWTKFSENLDKAAQTTGKKIGNVYDVASKVGVQVKLPRTYGIMRRELKSAGLIDEVGNLTRDAETISSPSLKGLAKTYQELHSTVRGNGTISIPQYKNLATQLEGYLGQDEQFNVPIYKTIRTLRNEGVDYLNANAQFRGMDIKNLNKEYSDNVILSKLSKRLNDVINEDPEKLEGKLSKLSQEKNVYTRNKYNRIYGKSVLDDIDAIAAARELYPDKFGGITKGISRQAVKGSMAVKDAARGAMTKIGGGLTQLKQIAGKGLKAVAPIGMVLQAINYADDPEKSMLEMYGYDTSSLAPKGSEDRKIQLGQIS